MDFCQNATENVWENVGISENDKTYIPAINLDA